MTSCVPCYHFGASVPPPPRPLWLPVVCGATPSACGNLSASCAFPLQTLDVLIPTSLKRDDRHDVTPIEFQLLQYVLTKKNKKTKHTQCIAHLRAPISDKFPLPWSQCSSFARQGLIKADFNEWSPPRGAFLTTPAYLVWFWRNDWIPAVGKHSGTCSSSIKSWVGWSWGLEMDG